MAFRALFNDSFSERFTNHAANFVSSSSAEHLAASSPKKTTVQQPVIIDFTFCLLVKIKAVPKRFFINFIVTNNFLKIRNHFVRSLPVQLHYCEGKILPIGT